MSSRGVPFGKYFLLERVNVGGMAEVFKGKMIGVEGFEKLLAIKRILPAIAADQDFINMFIDEAKISVQLNHANIAQTFELGRINDTYYIALEYVPGRDLRALFERHRRRGEPVPPELAAYAISRVAEGLDYAHRKRDSQGRELGIIHRDISPQNVLVSWEGEVKIIDFGIAKAANKIMKTQAGILKGKFGYMSPEQVRGLPLDRRSDIFAAGIVLYELLAGDRLFTGDSDYSILEKVRAANVPRISTVRKNIPQPLDRIVQKALAKDPDERYLHASDLVADLQRFLLSQEKLYTREDLSAHMKTLFPEEWERERKSGQDSSPPDTRPGGLDGEGALRLPAVRPASVRPEGRPRGAPPPPPPDSIVTDPDARPSTLAPKKRLAQAALAAETDKIQSLADDDDEKTATATDAGPPGMAPPRPPPRPPVDTDDLTPTPEDIGYRPDLELLNAQTKIARPGPPVSSIPPELAGQPSLPPRRVRMPAQITDNMPEPVKRIPPPTASDLEDETTVPERQRKRPSLRTAAAPADDATMDTNQSALMRAPAKAPAKPSALHKPIAIGDDDESTIASKRGQVYAPKKRAGPVIITLGIIAAVFVALALVKLLRGRVIAPSPVPSNSAPPPAPAPVAAPAVDIDGAVLGQLTVTTDPPDAQVFVDEKVVRSTGTKAYTTDRITVDVPHEIRAVREGYHDATQVVTVLRGKPKEVALKLHASGISLLVRSQPAGATVTIDGQQFGRTPESIGTLAAGTHSLHLELKCFEAATREITLSDADVTVEVPLKSIPGACLPVRPQASAGEPGMLRLMTRPPARVLIDGVDIGRETPLIDFPIAAGTHKIRLIADGRAMDVDVEVIAGKPVTKVVVIQ